MFADIPIEALVEPNIEIMSFWTYDPADPFVVTMRLNESRWVLGREVLVGALGGAATIPGASVLCAVVEEWEAFQIVFFGTPSYEDGPHAVSVVFKLDQMRSFLALTLRTIPRGKEPIDWDAELAFLS